VVDHRERLAEILHDDFKRPASPNEHLRIVGGRLDRPPDQVQGVAPSGLRLIGPAAQDELAGAPCRRRERWAEVWIARDCLAKQFQRLKRRRLAPAAAQRQRTKVEVVSAKIDGGARGRATNFRFPQRRFDHAGDADRDFVLQVEHIVR
jgi:hypothetical protein